LKILVHVNSITNLGLNGIKDATKLLKISKSVLYICFLYAHSIPFGCICLVFVSVVFNYTLYDLLIYGIPWVVLETVWAHIACYPLYLTPGQFFIVCYYLKLRLNSFRNKLANVLLLSSKSTVRFRIRLIKDLLREHHQICLQLNDYNKYWKKYLTITLTIFILNICFLSYIIFIAKVQLALRIEFELILSAGFLLVFILLYSASNISQINSEIPRQMHSVIARIKLPTMTKLKVSSSRKLNRIRKTKTEIFNKQNYIC